MENQKHLVEQIVRNIAEKLLKERPEEVGLYKGASGIALFLAYYFYYTQEDKYGEKAMELLSMAVENPTQSGTSSSLFSGTAGVGWVIQHLVNIDFMDEEMASQLKHWDDLIFESMMDDLSVGNYDLMHGAIGKGIYFIERQAGQTGFADTIQKLTKGLLQLAHHNSQGIYWTLNGSPDVINIGMAHGMVSVMRFLGEVYKLNIEQEACKEAIQGAFDWLWSHELTAATSKFSAGYKLNDTQNNVPSHLFWCHGDLSLLLTLAWMKHHTPELLRDIENKKFTELVIFESNRDLTSSGIEQLNGNIDTSVCHGLPGVKHIFHQISQVSNHQAVKEASKYWLKLLIEQYQKEQAKTLHQSIEASNSSELPYLTSIHGGLAGIAMVLLKDVLFLNDLDRNWDFYILTNTA